MTYEPPAEEADEAAHDDDRGDGDPRDRAGREVDAAARRDTRRGVGAGREAGVARANTTLLGCVVGALRHARLLVEAELLPCALLAH